MNRVNIWRSISPSADEVHAAYAAFGELPKADLLPRLVIARRAVAAGYYTDDLRVSLRSKPSDDSSD